MTDYLRAAGYFRVSDERQAGDNHWSLPVQRERYLAACKDKRWVPTAEFQDVMSGRKDRRPNYQRLVAAIRAGEIDVVVLQFLDRFGRNPREILRRYWELQELGVTVHVTDEDVSEELMLLVRAAIAGKESEKISARVVPTMLHVVKSGRWPGGAPYGYRLVQDPTSPERGHLVIDPVESAVVVRIFETYTTQHIGMNKIAGILNAEGIRSPRGGLWWASTVEFILMNEAYTGQLVWRGQLAPGGCPSIVDEDIWRKAQELLQRRRASAYRKPSVQAFLLAGLVRCACGTYRHCWTTFRDGYVEPRGYKRKPIRYYRCAHQAQQRTCHVGLVKAAELESWLIARLDAINLNAAMSTDEPDSETARMKRTNAERRQWLRSQIDRLKRRRSEAYDNLMDGFIRREMYVQKDQEYLAAIAENERELAALRDPVDGSATTAQRVRELFSGPRIPFGMFSQDELRSVVTELIERIDVVSKTEWRIVPKAGMAYLFRAEDRVS